MDRCRRTQGPVSIATLAELKANPRLATTSARHPAAACGRCRFPARHRGEAARDPRAIRCAHGARCQHLERPASVAYLQLGLVRPVGTPSGADTHVRTCPNRIDPMCPHGRRQACRKPSDILPDMSSRSGACRAARSLRVQMLPGILGLATSSQLEYENVCTTLSASHSSIVSGSRNCYVRVRVRVRSVIIRCGRRRHRRERGHAGSAARRTAGSR